MDVFEQWSLANDWPFLVMYAVMTAVVVRHSFRRSRRPPKVERPPVTGMFT
ncbi:hypothetical protein QP028_13840 [Corynebacterium suedekumii]|uniref:Uncharacterized protein n=1 Tax=Corynebacterium suedekumii TaxID=3049801 RepID=A0ABY8VK43_9CORY|nr:hypothetical protein [Corynebacterium suedekumii]WIM70005.1 hypothetical protein QP029_12560 [Corynebacterium suedekumii]WIM72273.1 hypothetical protein QP028_13840 [Corynebacterium suedekumii]